MCKQQTDIKMEMDFGKSSKKILAEQFGTMSAKEYLQQLYRADTIISQKVSEKEEIRKVIKNTDRCDISLKTDYEGSIYPESDCKEKIKRLIALEDDIDKMMDGFVNLRHKIICQIHDLNNANYIKVLYKRYVRFEKFEQIAVDLNFSIRNAYVVHGQALQEFQRKCMQ